MKYWKWWVYLLLGFALVVLSSFVPMPTVWRLIVSLGTLWYGMSSGIGLHKENLTRRAILSQRAHDPEYCNCDKCRYIRYENTLVVERIEIVNEPVDAAFNERAWKSHQENVRKFLEREALGQMPTFYCQCNNPEPDAVCRFHGEQEPE